jgi:hypothetical protein
MIVDIIYNTWNVCACVQKTCNHLKRRLFHNYTSVATNQARRRPCVHGIDPGVRNLVTSSLGVKVKEGGKKKRTHDYLDTTTSQARRRPVAHSRCSTCHSSQKPLI